ncbi:uncharacterized protein [Chiloscyllium punctatum]|uniref:uncharacterized protein isoform X2 n=1 Tax=Chiloscyllium punctatum TaxID=137246 RepID=UPI003B639C9C
MSRMAIYKQSGQFDGGFQNDEGGFVQGDLLSPSSVTSRAALDGRGSEQQQPLILEPRPRRIIQTRRKTTPSVKGNRHSGTSLAEREMMLYLALFLFLPFATAAPAALVSEGPAGSKDFPDEHGEDDRTEVDIGKEGIISIERAPLEAKSDSDGFVKVVDFDSLPLNYHDEENEEELVGDKIFHKYEKIDKETDDITGDTILSEREVIEEDDDDFPERRVIEPLHWQQ